MLSCSVNECQPTEELGVNVAGDAGGEAPAVRPQNQRDSRPSTRCVRLGTTPSEGPEAESRGRWARTDGGVPQSLDSLRSLGIPSEVEGAAGPVTLTHDQKPAC